MTRALSIALALLALAGCDQQNTADSMPGETGPRAAPVTGVTRGDVEGIEHGPGPYGGPGASPPPAAGGMDRSARMKQLTDWIRGAYVQGAPTEPSPEVDEALEKLGEERYATLCESCHGPKGDGKGPETEPMDPKPRNFVNAVYKLRSTPSGKLPTDADLFRTITAGLHGSAMIPFVPLPERERWALVHRIKRFSDRFADAKPVEPIEVPEPPEESGELVEQGRGLFTELGCADCHGAEGKGDGKRSEELKDDAGNPISPRDLTEGRFRRGTEMKDLYLTLRTGFDGTPMAAVEGHTDEQIWALAAFVRSIVNDPVHRQDNPPVHPQERIGLRIGMRALMSQMSGGPR
jgi:cytochrome c oxidase cbb3-type subunit 2